MNMTYIGVGVLVVIIVAIALLYPYIGGNTAATTTVAQAPTTTQGSNAYNTTTTVLPSNSSVPSNASVGCTPSKYYTCSNLTYTYFASNGSSAIKVTVGQDTGSMWSSFGIGYAPEGTNISGGVPSGIMFYTANDTSASNVGTSLSSGNTTTLTIPAGANLGNSTKGTLWVCYVNSGILYVGSTCVAQRGVSATYVAIGTVNAQS